MATDLRAAKRGRLHQVVAAAADGSQAPVQVALYGCVVMTPPHAAGRGNKTYMTLRLDDATGDLDRLRQVDDFVARRAAPDFSPLMAGGTRLVVKVPAAGVGYECERGDPTGPWTPGAEDVVDVVLAPGAFGAFGYCWLLRRIKPCSRGRTA